MGRSLAIRINRLEAAAPNPAAPEHATVPPALLAYLETLPEELFHDPTLQPTPVAGQPDLQVFVRNFSPRCAGLAVLGGLMAQRCAPGQVSLSAVQADLLRYGWHTLLEAHTRALPPGVPEGRAITESWARMNGTPWTGYGYFDDASGRQWPGLWRTSGTRDRDTQVAMGFGAAELALLAADE